MTKSEIRILMKARAEANFGREWEMSAAVCEKIKSISGYREARRILAYMAMPGEVSLESLLSDKTKTFVIPKVVGDRLELREFDPKKIERGYRGILEPSDEARKVGPEEIDFALVPGVAFDRAGGRLGHGKGFYDKLLPELTCPKEGVCFSYRIVDEIPSDSWDMRVEKVITEI